MKSNDIRNIANTIGMSVLVPMSINVNEPLGVPVVPASFHTPEKLPDLFPHRDRVINIHAPSLST